MKFLYCNARSLNNKFESLAATAELHDPCIIGVAESWLRDHTDNAEVSLRGYEVFRNDRQDGRRGGGVLLYVKSELHPTEYSPKSKFPEQVWCTIKDKWNKEYHIGVIYRSPTMDTNSLQDADALCELIVEMHNKNIILMGDFNYGNIDWNTLQTMPGASAETISFLDCIENNCLNQHVKEPTRGDNILDLILTKDPDIVQEVEVIDSLAESDHCMVTWMMDISRCPQKQREMFDYYKGDYEAIGQKLQGINWNDYLVGDTEQRWQVFKDLLVQLQRTHIPVKTFRKNAVKKAVWLDRKAVAAVRRKRRVYCKYKDNNHPAVKTQNKRARSELKRAKWKFEKKMAANMKSDTKSFFAYIRSLSSSSVKPTVLHQQDGSKTSSPEETCNEFNEYFSSVFTSETMDNMVQPPTVF